MKTFKKYFLMLVISLLTFFTSEGQTPVIKTNQHILKVGDDVKLRSGGPAMTIEAISKNRIRCSFINKRYEYVLDEFNPEELELLDITLPDEYNLDSHSNFNKILLKLILLQNSID